MQRGIGVYIVEGAAAFLEVRVFRYAIPGIGQHRFSFWIVHLGNLQSNRVVIAHGDLARRFRKKQPFCDDSRATGIIQIFASTMRTVNAFNHRKRHNIYNPSSK